jgi:hypothetical protein
MKFYSAIKKKEIMLSEGKWMELKNHHLKQSEPGSKSQMKWS